MGPEKRARILLADDHADALAQAARVLGRHWDIAGTVSNGVELVAVAARLDPDVIVLDIAMPLMDGFEAARTLRQSGNRSRFVFLTVWDDDDYRAESERVGADAYVVKSRLASDLVAAVQTALAHQGAQSP